MKLSSVALSLQLLAGVGVAARTCKYATDAAATVGALLGNEAPGCKCFPGDACWPSPADWESLNKSVGGRLVQTTPIGAPCHGATFDAEACKALQKEFQFEKVQ